MRHNLLHTQKALAGALMVLAAATLPALADYPSTVLSQGPVGYWRLNETTPPPAPPILATNIGSVGPVGDGVYTNAIRGVPPGAIVSEPNGAAVGFSGVSSSLNRVRIPFASQWNPSGPFSVEFWAKPAQTSTLGCPAASVEFISTPALQRNGWLFYQGNTSLSDGNGWVFRQYNNDISAGPILTNLSSANADLALDTNRWYHLVGVYDGTNISIYVNGALGGTTPFDNSPRPNTNSAIPLTFGARADGASGAFEWTGLIDEGAVYDAALTPAQVLTHYQAGTNPAPPKAYSQVILADNPAGYWRFNEPPDPPAANLGSLASAANGKYVYNAAPGQAGPRPPPYPGFETANNAVSFDGVGGGYVSVPGLNLNTNTVTITGWINAAGSEPAGGGIILNRSSSTQLGGLTVDVAGGLNLSYNWNNDPSTFNWASGVSLANADWTYVALIIRPYEAELYAAFGTNYTSWTTGTNFTSHQASSFSGPTLLGADYGPTTNLFFNGLIDEVAIFNRSLSEGEVYSQYSSAIGGVAPQIFSDVAAPVNQPFVGDTLSLVVDVGGTPSLGYQWRKNTQPIQGANSSTLTIPNLQTTDAGSYDVVVTNLYGKVTSSAAVISIQAPTKPAITQGPTGRTLYQGGLLDLTVVATGGQLQYQWVRGGTNIPGATTSAYIVTAVTGAEGGVYTVTVTNSLGSAVAGPATVNVVVPAANSYEATIVADQPEAWWRLDEPAGSTTMLDAMGRHDGVYVGTVTLGAAGAVTNGTPDTAASFDGTNGFGDVPYSSALNSSEFTIEAWAFLEDNTVPRAVVSTYDTSAYKGIFFQANPNGTWESDVGLNDTYIYYFAPMGNIVRGHWAYLAATFSSSAGQINYLNGQESQLNLSQGAFSDFVRNSKFDFLVGAVGTNWQGILPFKGTLDEVAVYTHALTPQQIQNHYVQALYGNSTKPIFLTQPQPVTIAQGDSSSFSAQVEGSLPITYQWFKNGAPIPAAKNPSATNSSLTIQQTAFTDAGTYQLVATNPAGTNASTVVSLTVLPPVTFANATNGLVLHLKFDGNYNDSSGRGNNGTAVGAPSFVPGQMGQALHYSTTTTTGGSGGSVTNANYVTLGHPTDLQFGAATSFSVAFWVRLPANYLNGDLPFFGSATNSANNPGFTFCPSYQAGGWEWCLQDFNTNDIDVNGPENSINDGSWHHFAATFDRENAVAVTYLDGTQVDSHSIATLGLFDTTNPVTIGQDPTGLYPESGSADLDDLGVWRRILSPLEVYEIYYSGAHYGAALDAYGSPASAPPPSLTVTTSLGSSIVVVWSGGVLYEADTPLGPWTTKVPGATPPTYTITPGTGTKFYRVGL